MDVDVKVDREKIDSWDSLTDAPIRVACRVAVCAVCCAEVSFEDSSRFGYRHRGRRWAGLYELFAIFLEIR